MNLGFRKRRLLFLSLGLTGLAVLGYALSTRYSPSPMLLEILPGAALGAALAILIVAVVITVRGFSRRRGTLRELDELKELYRLFSEGMKDSAFIILNTNGTVRYWSSAAEQLQGFTGPEIIGKHYSLLFPEADIQLGRPDQCLKTAEETGQCEDDGSRIRKDGSLFQAHSIFTLLRNERGGARGFSVVTRDVTEQKRSEELLNKLALIVEQAADLVVITDRTGKVEYVNKAVEEVTGYTRAEFIAGGMALVQADKQAPAQHQEMWGMVLAGRTFQAEAVYVKKNGEPIYLNEVATPIKDGTGNVKHVVFTGSDRTPIRLIQNKLDYIASYDSLTGLPNRDLLAERLGRELAASKRGRSSSLAVLAIDIDRFKYLNEIYGLDAGNKVLRQVAE
ncbi:MAG TPA: PAS domain S-box protein, partial [Nitrospirota bacterium]|nr:PAS domain S-box protein [Nitrospirota bacterium]